MSGNKNTLLVIALVLGLIIFLFFILSQKPKNNAENLDFTQPISTQTSKPDLDINASESTQDPNQNIDLNDPNLSVSKPNINLNNQNTMTNQEPVTELQIEDIQEGTGTAVKSGDTISINYIGTLQDGTKFDSSYDRGQPFETQIGVGQVIPGWDQGIIGLKVGGKRKLTIPYQLAYGEQGVPGTIPPKATLIFEVELVAIKN